MNNNAVKGGMSPMVIGVVGLLLCVSSSAAAALMMGGDDDAKKPSTEPSAAGPSAAGPSSAGPPPVPWSDWRIENGIDYPGNDLFHYHPNSTPIGEKSVCLEKCKELSNCKLVTFNNTETLCWGKSQAQNQRPHGDRNNYYKP